MPRDVVPICALAPPRLGQHIELAVIREDEVRAIADEQAAVTSMPSSRELVDLGEERLRVDDDAVADDAGDVVVQNARRNETQNELRGR